jgi:immune inhibitor A
MKHPPVLIAVATLALAVACCCCGSGVTDWNIDLDWIEEILGLNPTPTPQPGPTPVIIRDPVTEEAVETEELLRGTVVPVRDLHELAIRLRGLPATTPRTVNPGGSPDYALGTRRVFHVSNVDTDVTFDVTAELRYQTAHVYMWVEEGVRLDEGELAAAAELFEEHTYATNRAFFGSEWSPGVDNDVHVSVLHAEGLGDTVAGYYSSADEFVGLVREDSNEMEMFYINVENVRINSSFYNGVLAHEFQHMIHWYNDRNEETWLNEGFAELAMELNGFEVGGSDYTFARQPDTQLNSWPEGPGAAGANYGAGYLFTTYFLDRYGGEATQALVEHEENGFGAVDAVLSELGEEIGHEELFADWVVANLADEEGLGDGRYGYGRIDPPEFALAAQYGGTDYPVSVETTVHQYGTDYVELSGGEGVTFRFEGSTQIGLVDTQAHSGQYLWWSNRGDDSDMSLTRGFDLRGVEGATLGYWCWYDIEEDWDYAYVEVSTDGGQTWEILTTPSGTPTNPNGNSFGWGYTGRSGGSEAEWIREEVDLSGYAGREVLVRFEYVTDDAVNRPGFALDDVEIEEIGYAADLEEDGGGWEAAGFIRHANVLPQRWLVQMVVYGAEMRVERLEVGPDQTGEWEVPLGGDVRRAVIAISALAPVTTEPASYRYEIAYP